ncbi:MAG TPA: thioredoxin family protein [Casimicrobiaceae bacterium]|nr:thioredoxin family protein [Casimicrobiaceae bacterium]
MAFAGFASGAPVKTEHVVAELVAADKAVSPGQTLDVALRLDIQKGWHTYWRNPGDSGLPTTLAWKLPQGYGAGDIEWPAPHALPAGPLVNYGYENEVMHLVRVSVPRDAVPGSTANLAARADWLVCKETCIPDGADLTLSLPIAAKSTPDPRWSAPIAAARAALPRPLQGWKVEARGEGATVVVSLTSTAGAIDAGTLRFFPYAENRIEPSAPQPMERDASGAYVLKLPVSSQLKGDFGDLEGVVSASNTLGNGTSLKAATLKVPLVGSVAASAAAASAPAPVLNVAPPSEELVAATTLVPAIVFAFLGGMILNLMPCVFPVLSLKALSLAAPGHVDHRTMRLQGIGFGLGVIATFLGLAAIMLVLRAAGEQLGWGFQLQSPAMVTALALLFFVLALNLSGVFEFGTLVPASAAGWTARNPYADAFLSGILAVVIASPCTAPFMGAALGFALAQPTAATLAVFIALGVGMALPYGLLTWFPGWRRVLPRPGAWMERMKQLLAFPLYATVAWLAWVLGAQLDNDAVMRLLATLVVVAFVLWSWRIYRAGGARAWQVIAAAGLIGAVVVARPLFLGDRDSSATATAATSTQMAEGAWRPFDAASITEATNAGRAVFVDFTAAWCVTCQVNKKLVLNTDAVREAFARSNVELQRADWTRRDPAITRALASLGRNGVPVYVLYRPGQPPLLLPEVLQKKTVLDALGSLDSSGKSVASR